MTQTYKYLHFVDYSTFLLWDIKRYFMTQVSSLYPIVRLGDYIKEESTKYKINDPAKTYGILGVNTQTGIFDAYMERGSNIKQKYKKMQVGWIAYNPYRVNVGSIGMRTDKQNYEYISPAYVVFSCKERELSPEFLYLLMKTDVFNQIIRENTTGSVRQNLNYSVLANLQIPLPSLEEQANIVSAYNSAIVQSALYARKAQDIDSQIEAYWKNILGIEILQETTKKKTGYLQFCSFKYIEKWGYDFIRKGEINNSQTKYPTVRISDVCDISSGGTPARGRKEYYNGKIPWIKTGELKNEELFDTEEKITELGLENSSAKLYPKGSLVVAMYGATIGKTAKLGVDATTNQACAVLFNIQNKRISTDYLWLYIQSQTDKLKSMAYGGAQPNINAGIIANYNVPLPPLDIQNEIVSLISALRAEQKALQQQSLSLRSDAQHQFTQTIFN